MRSNIRGGYTRDELKETKEQQEREREMTEKVICSVCGVEYTDEGSIDLVKKWAAECNSPCPNISCGGNLEIKES